MPICRCNTLILGTIVPSCAVFVHAGLKQFPRWLSLIGVETQVSVMRNHVDIDHKHCRAIILEIGERLRASLREEPELPASFKTQIDRLRELEDQESPSIVPDKGERQRASWRKR